MIGYRRLFSCPHCALKFFFWVPETNQQPKVKCSYCHKESFPFGEPPPQPIAATAPAPAPEPAPAAGQPEPPTVN